MADASDPTSTDPQEPRHPLHQIAESATHRLLLKQWLKEEGLIARRVALRESRLDAVRKEVAALYCSFFALHSLAILLLFSSSDPGSDGHVACRRSWIPCLCSLLSSVAIVWAIRYKTDTETAVERLLEREEEDGMLMSKCVEELKRRGTEFDLLKEVDALRRAKSLRVDAKGPLLEVRKWSPRDLTTMLLLVLACGVLGLTRKEIILNCSTSSVHTDRDAEAEDGEGRHRRRKDQAHPFRRLQRRRQPQGEEVHEGDPRQAPEQRGRGNRVISRADLDGKVNDWTCLAITL